MNKLLLIGFLLTTSNFFAQNYTETILNIPTVKDSIYGTLMSPKDINNPALVILIAGSGATDRDGNQASLKNNSLLFLAQALSEKGIATYRYDKSVLAMIKKANFNEADFTFSILLKDANTVGQYFKEQKHFSKIVLAGHSQGSLVGLLVAPKFADAYISLAGAGNPIDVVIKEQLLKQIPQLEESFTSTLTKLKKGKTDPYFNPMLVSVFRLSVQPFLMDWMQYDPQSEIKKLNMPILIINGTNDIQVSENEAQLLHAANPKSQLTIIENMNHIFKEINGDLMENQLSYVNPDLPVMTMLIERIVAFVK